MDDDTGAPGQVPDSQLPYDGWTEEALRFVAVRALQHAAAHGMPGGHHFYVTFRTDFPGVTVPQRVRDKYPQEMTIVLQHQFHDLRVDETAGLFAVTLYFNSISTPLVIPFAAVSAFVDPYVKFGLRFHVAVPEPPIEPQVVSLDAFRKRKD